MSDTISEEPEYTEDGLADEVRMFLTHHKDVNNNYKYLEQIDGMMPKSSKYIVIDYNDLVEEPKIEKFFHTEPDRILNAFSQAIGEVLRTRFPGYAESIHGAIRARIANFPLHRSLREINSETISRITSVSGMVVRASEIKPLAKKLVFKCSDGHSTTTTTTQGMSVDAPTVCSNPDCKHRNLEMSFKESDFIDFQILRLQELPEDLPPGQIPHYIDVNIKQDLVDNARPGDRIVLTGIVRIEQEPVRGVSQGRSGLHRLRIEGNNIEFLGGRGTKTSRKMEREEISPEEEKIIQGLVRSPGIYERLVESFAPHISEHEIIKEAIVLLLVGSNRKQLPDGSSTRGDINVFLVGDPGTAKSEMLKFCARIAPRGLYTSGRGSTAAGLTAAVVKDKSGMLMLEAGAVVLGDQGLVCIDEFDKMKNEDRSALHEVMEQQSASIAKGGIVATLNARTSILAAANPVGGRYDPFKTIVDNAHIPLPLLTRFDLIYIIRDIPTAAKDKSIAKHIITRHHSRRSINRNIVDPDILTKYFAYAKRFTPELTDEAVKVIMDHYLKVRSNFEQDTGSIQATPRQLEGIIRLATARARLLMKDLVEEEDATRAIFLMDSMLTEAGYDASANTVDVRTLYGKGSTQVNKQQIFTDILRSLEGDEKQPVPEKTLLDELAKTNMFDSVEARQFLDKIKSTGMIYESKPGHYNRVP